MSTVDERAQVEARLLERIKTLDLADLQRLEAAIAAGGEQVLAPASPGRLTRRQLLTAAAAGGAALAIGGIGGSILGANWGEGQGAARTRREMQKEIERLQGLVDLYENLERIGIDAIIGKGIDGVELAIKALKGGVLALRKAVEATEAAISLVDATLDPLRAGLSLAEGFVSLLRGQIRLVQTTLSEVTGRISPLAEALSGFFTELISRAPFGMGEKVQETGKRITELISGLPDALDGIYGQLLAPLRLEWLSKEEGKGLQGRLLIPLRRDLLKPLTKFLDDIIAFLEGLEGRLLIPTRNVLEEREKVRRQIKDYKANMGLP